MKKSKIKMLTATACLALIGTASAAWVYAGTATESANIGVKVASYASAGEITVTGADNVYVYIDNGSITFMKKDASLDLAATHTAPSGLSLDSSKEVKLTYQVVINSGLANLVKFGSSVTTIETTDNSVATDWTRTWESGSDIFSSLPTLDYANNEINNTLKTENNYKSTVATLLGYDPNGTDYSWYDQNTEWTALSKFDVTINFKAEVVDKQ